MYLPSSASSPARAAACAPASSLRAAQQLVERQRGHGAGGRDARDDQADAVVADVQITQAPEYQKLAA